MKLPVLRHLNLTQFLVPGKVIASTFCFCILINQNVFFFYKDNPFIPFEKLLFNKIWRKGTPDGEFSHNLSDFLWPHVKNVSMTTFCQDKHWYLLGSWRGPFSLVFFISHAVRLQCSSWSSQWYCTRVRIYLIRQQLPSSLSRISKYKSLKSVLKRLGLIVCGS